MKALNRFIHIDSDNSYIYKGKYENKDDMYIKDESNNVLMKKYSDLSTQITNNNVG
jgi:hypothetical protein